MIDGPAKDASEAVSRREIALSHLTLTPFILTKLPKGCGSGAIAKFWEKNEIDKKWAESNQAKKAESQQRRRELTDFERFKVMRLKKQVSTENIAQ